MQEIPYLFVLAFEMMLRSMMTFKRAAKYPNKTELFQVPDSLLFLMQISAFLKITVISRFGLEVYIVDRLCNVYSYSTAFNPQDQILTL